MNSRIIYELPLTDPLRVLFRLEYLFKIFYGFVKNNNDNIFNALKSVDEILTIIQSDNVIKYLLTESDNLYSDLIIWKDNPNVDSTIFEKVVADLQEIAPSLVNAIDITIISENNFFKDFRKKCHTPGNLSPIDFPRFEFWTQQNNHSVAEFIQEWIQVFNPLHNAIELVLKLIRSNSIVTENIAYEGYFQENLNKDIEYRLVRVVLPENMLCFADITCSRYHITIRMLQDNWNFGSTRYKKNVNFSLIKCHR